MNFIEENFRKPEARDGRIQYIDLAKGICIILVVILHIDADLAIPGLGHLRMPLYFVLSGLFFKFYPSGSLSQSVMGGGKTFLFNKLNKLMIPFFFFYLIGGLYQCAGKILNITDTWFDPLFVFKDFHFANGPIWFLLCLFYCNVIFMIIKTIPGKELKNIVCVSFCAFLGYHMQDRYTMFFGTALTAMPYFYFGYFLKNSNFLSNSLKMPFLTGIMILIATISAIAYFEVESIMFTENIHQANPLVSLFLSCLMVIGVLLICKAINWLPIVSYLGRYSIVILCTHALVIMSVSKICARFNIGIDNQLLYNTLLFCIVMSVCWIFIPLLRKYCPYVIAQKDVIPTQRIARQESPSLTSAG